MGLHTELNNWQIDGELSYASVPKIEKLSQRFRQKINTNEPWIISCQNLDHLDSAGLAWLLENTRYANKHDLKLEIKNLTLHGAKLLAQTQGILDMLPLSESNSQDTSES